ncbi:MAG: histidinol-phosphate transaminase [Alcanivoracaceae bacterium]|nr:histidinol-phosphate transaminase [Alcanivoracaceae bacterium]
MSRFWSDFVHKLEPYVPGEQPKVARLVKLNTNENPYGPSPKAVQAMAAINPDSLRLYPDPDSSLLKQSVATFYGIDVNQIFAGNGSDEVLAHIFYGFFKQQKPLLFPDITYSFYKVYCGLYDIEYKPVALAEDFSINVNDYVQPNGGIIFPNPNAPTGLLMPLAEVESLLQRNTESLVVVDEAYIDFGGESAGALINQYPNLLVTQTLSKSRSLAGLRIGLAIGQADLIEGLERVKNCFNSYPIDQLANAAGAAAFDDVEYFDATRKKVMESRESLRDALAQRGFSILPSATNFLFARHAQISGDDLAARLRKHGVIVRHFAKPERISEYLRITIGTEEQNQALLAAYDAEC